MNESLLDPAASSMRVALEALVNARAHHFGFDTVEDALADIRSEYHELVHDCSAGELGDVLFACVNMARIMGVDPDEALMGASTRFTRRVQFVVQEAPTELDQMSSATVGTLWDRAKLSEIDDGGQTMDMPNTVDEFSADVMLQYLDGLQVAEQNLQGDLNMVPSENRISRYAQVPFMLDIYNRYMFTGAADDGPEGWPFRGGQESAVYEFRLIDDLCRLSHAEFVNVRPISGLNAMTLALGALGGPPGSSIATISPDLGGHYATRSLAERLGLVVHMITGTDTHTLDMDSLERCLQEHQPTLLYVDQSICLFPLDVRAVVGAVRRFSPETVVHVDVSHWMGLVLGGVMTNPLDAGADSFGGSTHKTFPGPQKGFLATNSAVLRDKIAETQFYMISSHHFAATVALGLAVREFEECLLPTRYPERVLSLTSAFAEAIAARGVEPECRALGFSSGHQLWLRTAPIGVDAFEASARLGAAGIRLNAFPDLPGIAEPALRIGLNEAARIGVQLEQVDVLADAFVQAIRGDVAPARRTVSEIVGGLNPGSAPSSSQVLAWLTDTWATRDA